MRVNNRHGFTLIEILVTLAILGLVFSVVTFNFRGMFETSRLKASARALGDNFAVAVSRAYTTGTFHTLVFDLDAGCCRVRQGREGDEDAEDVIDYRLAGGVSFKDIQVGYEKYEPPGTLSIEVSPLGVTSDFIVNLEDASGLGFAVSMNALVQSVKYHERNTDYEDLQDVSPF
jgi:prepilin-type N-terminal cleavage/methylation domain-containing protein